MPIYALDNLWMVYVIISNMNISIWYMIINNAARIKWNMDKHNIISLYISMLVQHATITKCKVKCSKRKVI